MNRLEFSKPTKREAFRRSGGICECHLVPFFKRTQSCGVKLVTGGIYFEHINPDGIAKDNSLSNIACLCKTCWRAKTSQHDLPVIAKSNRTRDRAQGIKRASRPMGRQKEAKPLTPKMAWLQRMREVQS